MPRYKLTIEYDGTDYSGWQRQEDVVTVQATIEAAAAQFLGTGAPVTIQCAGRTDAGVHARGQVAHMDLPVARETGNILQGINTLLRPHAIAIVAVQEVAEDFHARFGASKRHYLYRLVNRQARLALDDRRAWHVRRTLDLDAMNAGAQHLIGHHDFTSFRAGECQAKSPIKTLDTLEVIARENRPEQVMIRTSATSFLHHQVRNMVGTLVYVGIGKWTPDQVRTARDAKDRRAGGPMAPAHGLYLMKVDY
ncbi:MAG: tRNA pseudouridine(38-40) synthase TruA [Pseudomonadota bacterium]